MKTQFESLKSEKFAKTTISPEAMRMVNGGMYQKTGEVSPNKGVADTITYSCCDGSYDKTVKCADGTVSTATSREIFDNTKPYWYTNEGQI